MLIKIIKYSLSLTAVTIVLMVLGSSILFINGGALREVQNQSPSECKQISSPKGSIEDLQIDRGNNTALLSVLDRRAKVQGKKVNGIISEFDLTKDEVTNSATINTPHDFQPHGLSLFHDNNGNKTLFVINHSDHNGELIEIFKKSYSQKAFLHYKTLSSPLLNSPNDIVAISPNSFYVANDSGATNILERALEFTFSLGISPLVYFNGKSFETVKNNLRSSSGINILMHRSLLVVGETAGKAIRIYQLALNGSIENEVTRIPINGAVDNIDIDAEGNLWIANHIDSWSLTKSFIDQSYKSPTQIQKIVLNDDLSYQITTIYENDGQKISAGSVGAAHNYKFLIGSITDRKLLICKL